MGIRVVVAGGSLGGLTSALALHCVNCDVDVFERSRGVMKSRGAGLVVQTELIDFLKDIHLLTDDLRNEEITIEVFSPSRQRMIL